MITDKLNIILQRFGVKLKAEMTRNYNSSGVRASGKSIESLRSEVSGLKYTMYGAGYWAFIDRGRGATIGGGDGSLFAKIFEWLGYKKYGLNYSGDKERKSLAYAITKKIHKEGTYRHINKSSQTKIIEDSLNASRDGLIKDVTKEVAIQIGTNVATILKDIR